MTLINKIREKSAIMIGAVALSMALFIVGNDLLSPNSTFFSGSDQVVGEISGQEISYQQFAQELEKFRNTYAMGFGRQPTEAEMPGIRSEVWDRLIFQIAYQEEYAKLGLQVSDEEMVDMIQGNNIDPSFANQFTNPQTGELDRNAIKMFLANINSYPVESQMFYQNFEESLRPNRLNAKYQNLLGMTYFTNKLEAKKEYEAQNSKADVRYLYVPYNSIADSSIAVEDSDLRDYYNDHKKDFERDANVSIEYVTYSILPSPEDEMQVMRDMEVLAAEFATTENDTAFTEANSEGRNNFIEANPGNAPTGLNFNEIEAGKVYGPFREGYTVKLYKVLSKANDTVSYARASHILIKVENDDKAAARKQAQDIINQIKAGADFAQMAMQYGTDGTRTRGGDLGWFDENTMVKPFSDAVMNARATGLLPAPVETEFGFHVIDVTGMKTNEKAVIASIEKEITASEATISEVYAKLSAFGRAKTREEFIAAADQDTTLIRYQALNIGKDARNINNLTDSRVREIVRWAHTEAEVGGVSEIIDMTDQFIVANVTDKQEEGVASFEQVKEEIRPLVLKEKKQEMILAKFKGVSGTLEDYQKAYGTGASLGSSLDVSLNSGSLPGVGFAPIAIGSIFKLQPGQTSAPIADESAVVVVELTQLDKAAETTDYTAYRQQVATRNTSGMYIKLKNAVEKLAEVENNLYKFF